MPDPHATNDGSEADEFVTLLMEHRHSLYAFISKQLVHAADVEDVFQKTSVILWKKMADYDPSASFFHWACGIAFNEVRNFLTTERRKRLHFDVELTQLLAEEAEDECELTEARLSALQACLSGLPQRQQDILRRCYLGSSSISEVAESLGRSRDALYKQLERLRGKLLACIRLRLRTEGVAS